MAEDFILSSGLPCAPLLLAPLLLQALRHQPQSLPAHQNKNVWAGVTDTEVDLVKQVAARMQLVEGRSEH